MNTQVREPKQGEKVADCRQHASMAVAPMHGTIELIQTALGLEMAHIKWPMSPSTPEVVAVDELRWSEGGQHWYLPRKPQERQLVANPYDRESIGRIYYAMDNEVGIAWSKSFLGLTEFMNDLNTQYDAFEEEHQREPTAQELNLAVVPHDNLAWNDDYGYWVMIDPA